MPMCAARHRPSLEPRARCRVGGRREPASSRERGTESTCMERRNTTMDQQHVMALTRTGSRGPARPQERRVKHHVQHSRIALILLAALALGGGLMQPVIQPAAAVVPGAIGRIAFQTDRDGDFEIYAMGPRGELGKHGTKAKKLTNNTDADVTPAWSPNGKKIAFASARDDDHEIYVMNADGSNQTRLTTVAGLDQLPTWSPDGSKIAFESNRDVGAPYFEIYVMDANGANPTRLTNNDVDDQLPAWSPDGNTIAFTSSRDGNQEIYVMNANGSNQTRLTTNAVTDSMPTWSPDGTRIAFGVSETGGSTQVFSMAADGSNPRRLTKGRAYNWYPDWQAKP